MNQMKRLALAAVLVVLVAANARAAEPPSLYERLGGVDAIATVVDEFIDRLSVNSTLNANPAIAEARDRVPIAGLKYKVTSFVAQATGGPEIYTGRPMLDSHAHLNISEREWEAMVADLRSVLYKYNVPDAEQAEFVALLGTVKGSIVAAR